MYGRSIISKQVLLDEIAAEQDQESSEWFLAGGVSAEDCLLAYKAIGTTSLADSYINLAHSGSNITAPSAPTWSAETGWSFDGISQYLLTGDVELSASTSIIIKCKNFVHDPHGVSHSICGCETGEADWYYLIFEVIAHVTDVHPSFYNGDGYYDLPARTTLDDGVWCLTRDDVYLEGVSMKDPESFEPFVEYAHNYTVKHGIAAKGWVNNLGVRETPSSFSKLDVLYYAVYNRTLTQGEALAISTAINSL